ncbi:MAG: pirin family protein [Maricaulaceae bacterium]
MVEPDVDPLNPIALVIPGRPKDLGGGFRVRRLLPYHKRRMVGPFIFYDLMGPGDFAPGHGVDVRPHPHIGLATVTYLFEGELDHHDTVGAFQTIRPGDVNWMSAGRGVVHSERTGPDARAAGHRLHGVQAWVALPKTHEQSEPGFAHHPQANLPVIAVRDAQIRLIAGTYQGRTSPVRFPHPIVYADVRVQAGARVPVPEAEELALFVVDGAARVGSARLEPLSLNVLRPGAADELVAQTACRVMALGGAPMDSPRVIDWNFVASDQALIDASRADWTSSAAAGFDGTRFRLPEGETEHIPLPD